MISYKQAYLKLLKNKIKIDNEKIKSDEACNRISATDILLQLIIKLKYVAFDGLL